MFKGAPSQDLKNFRINIQLCAEDDAILPEGFTPDTAQSQAGETENTNQPGSTTTQTEQVTGQSQEMDYSPFLNTLSEKIKYNHQPVKVESIDDVVANFQKGMNYDKLQEKFDAIQNDPRLSKYDKVQQVSAMLGYQSDDELISALFNTYYESVAQSQGLTTEQVRKEHEIRQRENALNQKEQNLTQNQKEEQMYERFLQRFPDVQETDIKPETWEKVRDGMDLTSAYIEQRNQELENRMKILEQNETNKGRAPVNGATQHGSTSTASQDPFEIGFDSVK